MEKNMKACSLLTIFFLFTTYFSIVSIGTGVKLASYNLDRQIINEDISKTPNEEIRIQYQKDYDEVVEQTNKLYNSENLIVKLFSRAHLLIKAIWLFLATALLIVDYFIVNNLLKKEIKLQLKREKRLEKHSNNGNKKSTGLVKAK